MMLLLRHGKVHEHDMNFQSVSLVRFLSPTPDIRYMTNVYDDGNKYDLFKADLDSKVPIFLTPLK